MNKKGFTLQELLVTMAIIGIVAAILAPAITGLFPDETKAKYIKAHSTLLTIIADVLSDPELYYTIYRDDGTPSCSGVNCTGLPTSSTFTGIWSNEGDFTNGYDESKLGFCVASRMNIVENFGKNLVDDVKSIDTVVDGDGIQFTTTDGIVWFKDFNDQFTIDIDGLNKGDNCSYATDCTSPDQFKFKVNLDGGVTAADALGIAYLQNATDLHSGKIDRELASDIVSIANSSTDVDKMYTALNTILKKKKTTTTTKK